LRPFRILRALEFLGPEQGVGEVDEQPRGHDASKPIIEDHGRCPLEPVAGVSVGNRSDEEAETESDQDDVQQVSSLKAQGRIQYQMHLRWCDDLDADQTVTNSFADAD
jgi:hypothetical protein